MTDAPLSIDDTRYLHVGEISVTRLPPAVATSAREQLAAAARVPALEAEIEQLRAELGIAQSSKAEVKRGAAALLAETGDLRARLAAVPDLTELREAIHVNDDAVFAAVRRLLAAVPSTGEPCGACRGTGVVRCIMPLANVPCAGVGCDRKNGICGAKVPSTGTDGGEA